MSPGRSAQSALMALALLVAGPAQLAASEGAGQERTSRISDDAVPLLEPEDFPDRPKPLIEIGSAFLGSGNISPGFRLPGGARWQPSFIAFGTLRTAFQSFDTGPTTNGEWANRLDLFGNLQLTGTERLIVGFRPTDRPGTLTGYRFGPEGEDGFADDWNGQLQTLFFEGELGELFPSADPDDDGSLDLGFAVGRQPLLPQEGILMADSVDAVGLIRNNILPRGGSNLQLTGIWAWNGIHRGDAVQRPGQSLYGLFASADYPRRTLYADVLWAQDREGSTDGIFWGLSSVQRLGHTNATFRALGSHALEDESSAATNGFLLMSELSWTPAWSHDIVYLNSFWAIDDFISASRAPGTGGPLGQVGFLFAGVSLGRYAAPLDPSASRAFGGAAGYQKFLGSVRRQLVLEAAVRRQTDGGSTSGSVGARLRQALGRRLLIQVDVFGAWRDGAAPRWGARAETLIQF